MPFKKSIKFPTGYELALTENEIDKKWPNLDLGVNGRITSFKDSEFREYNCLAFALGEKDTILDMDAFIGKLDVTKCGLNPLIIDHSLAAYIKIITHFYKFEICADGKKEKGYTKIALYEGLHEPSGRICFLHASLLMESDKWKSKLGEYEDIEHNSVDDLRGNFYGQPKIFLKRNKQIKISLF